MISLLISFFKILVVDLLMSADHALIVTLATKNLDPNIKKRAVYAGIVGAAVIRIFLASLALYLLQFSALRYVGGLLLLYVAWAFFRNLKLGKGEREISPSQSLIGTITVIIAADISLSLDNVLAVASIAENMRILALGIIASICMMLFVSERISKLMERYEWIQWGGLLIIVHTAIAMLLASGVDGTFFHIPVSMWGLFAMMWVISYLYYQNVTHVAFHMRKHHLHNHVRLGIIFVGFTVLILSQFVPEVDAILQQHQPELLTLLLISYIMLLELVMQQYSIDTYYMHHQGEH